MKSSYWLKNGFFLLLFLAASFVSENECFRRSFRNSGRARLAPKCPPEEKLLPCMCILKGTELHVRCENSEIVKIRLSLEYLRRKLMPIEELSLVANRLTSIPSRFLGSLQINKIFLMDNEMATISRNAFAGLENSLNHVYIRENLLEDIPYDTFDNLRELRTIVIEDTSIYRIPRLFSMPYLEMIKIDMSRISDIKSESFRIMPSMRNIFITRGRLKMLGENSMEGLIYLKEIDLAGNEIKWVHPGAFRNLEMVEILNLSGNNIDDATSSVMAAREMRSLRVVNISRNKIRFLGQGTFVDMPNLEEIDLSHNIIERIAHEAFYRLPNLNKLFINNNRIYHFEPEVFVAVPSLVYLNLANNNISSTNDIMHIYDSLHNLRKLDLSSNHIKGGNKNSLGGHLKLETLILNQNFITPLTKQFFRNLPNLRELYLNQNHIKKEDEFQIWDLPKLQLLGMSQNSLTKIDGNFLLGLPSLTDLHLSFNFITELFPKSFHFVPELKSLNVSYNKISKVATDTFKPIQHLFELDFNFNGITSVNSDLFGGLSSLKFLHLANNQIRRIDSTAFKDTVKLKNLDLSSNLLEYIPTDAIQDLTSLKKLCLRKNAIKDIRRGAFRQLRIIEKIDISHNHIQTIESEAFAEMNVLKDLDLNTNYIQIIPSRMLNDMKLLERLNASSNFINSIAIDTFKSVKQLRILDLTNNSLTSLGQLIHDLPYLQGLFLNHNYINKLTNKTFINLSSLNVLFFSNNGLQSIEVGTFYNLSSLAFLDLRHNNIAKINSYAFASLKSLRELQLSHNQIIVIEDYSFLNLPSLQSIELQENMITTIEDYAFDMIPSLRFLNLSRNTLKEVPHQAFSRALTLDVLDLSWNYIFEITDDSFRDLQWITVLLLHHNDICYLSDSAFNNPRSLRVLMLHNNQLKSLHLNALQEPIKSLSLLDMGGNPFICNCELIWLKEYLLQEGDNRVSMYPHPQGNGFRGYAGFGSGRNMLPLLPSPIHGQPICAGPPEYAGKPITEVPPEAFLCDRGFGEQKIEEEKCISRFKNQPIPGSNKKTNELTPEMLSSLMKLTNLSEIQPGTAEFSSIDYQNPIVISSLSELINNYSKQNETAKSVEEFNLQQSSLKKTSDLENLSSDFVTGDTPTFYAGSSSLNNNAYEEEKGTGSLFGLPLLSVPNIWDNLGKIKLPDFGINFDWTGLPFGRLGEGRTPNSEELGQVYEYLKTHQGSVNVDSQQVQALPDQKLTHYDTHYPDSSLGRKPLVSGRDNQTNVAKFNSIFSEPLSNLGDADYSNIRSKSPHSVGAILNKQQNNQGVGNNFGSGIPLTKVPYTSSMLTVGPGPNSGTPFLPGLLSKAPPSNIHSIPHLNSNYNKNFEHNDGMKEITIHKPSNQNQYNQNWNWPPPSRSYFLSGMNSQPSNTSYIPFKALDPNDPIIEVAGPNNIKVSTTEPIGDKNESETTVFEFLTTTNNPRSNSIMVSNLPTSNINLKKISNGNFGARITQRPHASITKFTTNSQSPTTKSYDHWTKSFVSNRDYSTEKSVLETTKEFSLNIKNKLQSSFEISDLQSTTELYVPVSLLPTPQSKAKNFTEMPDSHRKSSLSSTLSPFVSLIESFTTTYPSTETEDTFELFGPTLPATTKDEQLSSIVSNKSNNILWNLHNKDIKEVDETVRRQSSFPSTSPSKWWPPLNLGKGVSLVRTSTDTSFPISNLNKDKMTTKDLKRANIVKHVSPSRSVSLNSGNSPSTDAKKDVPLIIQVEPPSLMETIGDIQEEVQIITERPSFREEQSGLMDWYYSNYNKEYNPDHPLPIGGNRPQFNKSPALKSKKFVLVSSILLTLLVLI